MSTKPIIIGVAGKKQSGKTSLCEYLKLAVFSQETKNRFVDFKENFTQNEDGTISSKYQNQYFLSNIQKESDSYSRIVNFADALKKQICNQILGVELELLYGTDEQKNQLTRFKWNNLPDHIRFAYSDEWVPASGEINGQDKENSFTKAPRTGLMTARELMQVVGTDIFREMFVDTVWVDAVFNTIKTIKEPTHKVFFIPDVRFPSEVNAIIDNGGYIIKLSRSNNDDNHPSETSLDNFDFDGLGDRCFLIDNQNLSINEKNELAIEFLFKLLEYDSLS